MYLTHPYQARAVSRCLAMTRAQMGRLDPSGGTTAGTRLSPINQPFQELPMPVETLPNEKAAVAAAAPGALKSTHISNPIVPPLRRNAMGFSSPFSTNSPLIPPPKDKVYPMAG